MTLISRVRMPRRHVSLRHMREHPEPRPRDDRDAVQDMARDLADIAGHLSLEMARSAAEAAGVEAKRRVRLNEGRGR
jgi:hypothetical protein